MRETLFKAKRDKSCPVCECKRKMRIRTTGDMYGNGFSAGIYHKPIELWVCLRCGVIYCDDLEELKNWEKTHQE